MKPNKIKQFFIRKRMKNENQVTPIEFVERLRKEYKFSQQKLADVLKVSQPAYSQMLSRKQDITCSQALLFANLFNVDASVILYGTFDPKETESRKLASEMLSLSVPSQKLIRKVIDFEKTR